MNNELLRKVQLTQLEIAQELKRVCDLLGIDYFLDSGTLLGAVRHKGFIPWDDDMDIGFLRKEYERFLEEAPSVLDTRFFLQTWNSDKKYGIPFSKLRKNNTLFVEASAKNTGAHNGVYIDLFPYDVYPDQADKQKWQGKRYFLYRRLLLAKCGYFPWIMSEGTAQQKILKKIVYRIATFAVKFIKKEKLVATYIVFATKFNKENSKYYYQQAGATAYGKWLVKRECLDTLSTVEFERITFRAPGNPDEYLSGIYGNYMQIPPEGQREDRHKIIEVRL